MFWQRRDIDQLRKIQKVFINDNRIVECEEGESIYQVLADSGFAFLGNCGGKGICKRCFVDVGKWTLPGEKACPSERKRVLACEYKIQNNIFVYTGNLWQYTGNDKRIDQDRIPEEAVTVKCENVGVAVDLGSTTIAVSCMDLNRKEELTAFSFANPQYAYGADVISRIHFCIEKKGNLLLLEQAVRQTLKERLKKKLGALYPNIRGIVYNGNTTMLHILRGFSVEGLSKSPFSPVSTGYEETEEKGIKTIFPPGFSAFVGADILTGAEFLEMGKEQKFDFLIDLGTNGEMLLLNRECGYATATACGPVFDSAVTGAVYGSESMRAIANCVKRRLVDTTGRIAKPYFDKGIEIDKEFVIKQDNIRDFQLAKGAIYAGIQCLLKKADVTADKIANVYISGGLGFNMDIRDAFTVKMLPKEFTGKIQISGNSSLEGAKKLLVADQEEQQKIISEYEAIKKRTVSFELADLDMFQETYMQSLNF